MSFGKYYFNYRSLTTPESFGRTQGKYEELTTESTGEVNHGEH